MKDTDILCKCPLRNLYKGLLQNIKIFRYLTARIIIAAGKTGIVFTRTISEQKERVMSFVTVDRRIYG